MNLQCAEQVQLMLMLCFVRMNRHNELTVHRTGATNTARWITVQRLGGTMNQQCTE
jgi:hypothetical protein